MHRLRLAVANSLPHCLVGSLKNINSSITAAYNSGRHRPPLFPGFPEQLLTPPLRKLLNHSARELQHPLAEFGSRRDDGTCKRSPSCLVNSADNGILFVFTFIFSHLLQAFKLLFQFLTADFSHLLYVSRLIRILNSVFPLFPLIFLRGLPGIPT